MDKSACLIALGRLLRERGYRFVAITPASHERVLNQKRRFNSVLNAVFGWNREFNREELDPDIFELLSEAGALAILERTYRATVRFATIGDLIFLHSGFPTTDLDAVFFGPDTYRFVRAMRANCAALSTNRPLRVVDIGCGSGAGGVALAGLLGPRPELILADINQKALDYAAINAAVNHIPAASVVLSDVLSRIDGEFDRVISNPPYLVDEQARLYRHGGGDCGIGLSLRIAEEALARLRPGGQLILYTGTPITSGLDPFFETIRPSLQLYASQYSYEEIDPDVFGEELEKPAYAGTDRLAAVVLIATKKG